MGIVASVGKAVTGLAGGLLGIEQPKMPDMASMMSQVPAAPAAPPPPPSVSSPQVSQAAIDAKKKAAANAGAQTVATSPQGVQGAAMTTAKSLLGQ